MLRKSLLKCKKAQMEYPIISFIAVVVILLIMAPFMLKIFNSVLTPFASGVGNVSAEAGVRVNSIKDTFVNFWDMVIMIAFLISLILLLITAFLVDTHPVFLILFIVFGIFTFMFIPAIMEVTEKIYDNPELALEVSQLPMADFLREYFVPIMVGFYFIIGIIVYAKFRRAVQ